MVPLLDGSTDDVDEKTRRKGRETAKEEKGKNKRQREGKERTINQLQHCELR